MAFTPLSVYVSIYSADKKKQHTKIEFLCFSINMQFSIAVLALLGMAAAASALRPALGILEMADGEDLVSGPKMGEEGVFPQRQEGTVDALEDGRRRVDGGVARRRQFVR